MSVSLRPSGADRIQEVLRIADAARAADGVDPFNEQSRLDAAAGRRDAFAITDDTHGTSIVVGAAILSQGELDLVIAQERRGRGFGGAAVVALLARAAGELTAWSHGDHPAARALAARHGFEHVRTLLQLWRPLTGDADESQAGTASPAGEQADGTGGLVEAFRPGVDDEEWVALNARIFAAHPEQGAVTIEDLHDRMAEPWFDRADFLVAHDDAGRMIGYNWLKVAPVAAEPSGDREGEIYVIGVDAASAGRGLGRSLMRAGLERLRERGCTTVTLYVEGDNVPALGLYRSLGFVDRTVDVQYRRTRG